MIDISTIPVATFVIMSVAITISFFNTGLNRLLIARICGWEEYRRIRKETSEYQSQMMKAMRAKDKKLLDKLNRKKPQIENMQKKMFKPQAIIMPISFIYILIWIFFLTPANLPNPVAILPGLGPIPVVYWYMICAFFFGTLASRIIGTNPIE